MRAYHVLLPPGTRPPCRFEAMLAKEGGFGNKAAALYAQLDKDGDGQLTAEELKQVRQHVLQVVVAVAVLHDVARLEGLGHDLG